MEGALWKWTNYWSGWQLRWFVLDNGVLAYYKSQEDVNHGCKGSVKISTCEIVVHPHDNTRLTISIPGEQHLYLRAPSSQERQQWLVTLGSTKACVTMRSRTDSGDSKDSLRAKRAELRLYCDLLMQQAHQIKESAVAVPTQVDKITEASSFLSLTCDTFIQTLDECVKLVDSNFTFELPHQHVTDVGLSQGVVAKPKTSVPSMKRSSSYDTTDKKT